MPHDGARDLARLLPEFGEPTADPDPESARVRLFEQMLLLFERLAERRSLILIVEDAHWADRSTRDLLTFLLRNLRHTAVLLVITFRSDELHRSHPMRPVIAELERIEGVVRLDLPRLTRARRRPASSPASSAGSRIPRSSTRCTSAAPASRCSSRRPPTPPTAGCPSRCGISCWPASTGCPRRRRTCSGWPPRREYGSGTRCSPR